MFYWHVKTLKSYYVNVQYVVFNLVWTSKTYSIFYSSKSFWSCEKLFFIPVFIPTLKLLSSLSSEEMAVVTGSLVHSISNIRLMYMTEYDAFIVKQKTLTVKPTWNMTFSPRLHEKEREQVKLFKVWGSWTWAEQTAGRGSKAWILLRALGNKSTCQKHNSLQIGTYCYSFDSH